MKLTLTRRFKGEKYTIGRLEIDGEYFCDTIEDKDRGLTQDMNSSEIANIKVKHQTAIPSGSYTITLKVQSPKYSQRSQYNFCKGYLPRLLDVPGFDGILIHIGNKHEDSSGCILVGENKVKGQVINSTATFKKLYEKLKEKESDTTKLHKTVFRPWGYYTCMNRGEGYLTKTICVLPKQKLSIQSHNHRSEHWVVLEGKALVLLDGKENYLESGDSIDIPLQAKHSLQNPYDKELKIIEVQKGDYISEDDIIRYEDCYGRV
jgi:mannose-6-phosphate isomerase-like protein (cupin superfamily)